jgi:hypothetical protein
MKSNLMYDIKLASTSDELVGDCDTRETQQFLGAYGILISSGSSFTALSSRAKAITYCNYLN